jgi:hypothetical protein
MNEELTTLSVSYCKIWQVTENFHTNLHFTLYSFSLQFAQCANLLSFVTFIITITTAITVGHTSPTNEKPTAHASRKIHPLTSGKFDGCPGNRVLWRYKRHVFALL